MLTLRLFIALASVLIWFEPAKAQVFSWECQFPEMPRLKFEWDLNNKTATVFGNAGSAPVMPFAGKNLTGTGIVAFVEPTQSGVVQTVTIVIASGEAVYSRHTVIASSIKSSQQRGSCKSS